MFYEIENYTLMSYFFQQRPMSLIPRITLLTHFHNRQDDLIHKAYEQRIVF